MENTLRTDIVCDRSIMTKEEEEAYDGFIDALVRLCRKYGTGEEEKNTAEGLVTSA